MERLDFETQVDTVNTDNLLFNVQNDIMRRSSTNQQLKRKREKERDLISKKRDYLKEDLIAKIGQAELYQYAEVKNPLEKEVLEADLDIMQKFMLQDNKIKQINEDSSMLKQKLRDSYYNIDLKLGRINRSRVPNLSKGGTDYNQGNPSEASQLVQANLTSLV